MTLPAYPLNLSRATGRGPFVKPAGGGHLSNRGSEMAERVTKCEAVRRLLAPGRWVHMRELLRVGGYRYGARIWQLSQRGFNHETKRDPKSGAFFYRWRP